MVSLTVGYVEESFPQIYHNPYTKKMQGLYPTIWYTIAEQMGVDTVHFKKGDEYGSWTADSNGTWDGMLEDLQDHTINATAEGYSYRTDRLATFRFTMPIDYYKETFYVAKEQKSDVSVLDNFLVFSPTSAILFFITAVVVILVERFVFVMHHRWNIRGKNWALRANDWQLPEKQCSISFKKVDGDPLPFVTSNSLFVYDSRRNFYFRIRRFLYEFLFVSPSLFSRIFTWSLRRISFGFYLISVFFCAIIYSATFTGHMIKPTQSRVGCMEQMRQELTYNKKSLIMMSSLYLKDVQVLALFGSDVSSNPSRLSIQPSLSLLMRTVCTNRRYIAYLSESQLTLDDPRNPTRSSCNLAEIDTDDIHNYPDETTIRKSKFGQTYPGTFYLNRKTGRRTVEKVNQIILKMFSYDMIFNYWWRKFTNRPRLFPDQKTWIQYQPVSISRLQTILYVAGGGYIIAILVLILEVLFHKYNNPRKPLRIQTPKLKTWDQYSVNK